jgi:hypothetical protein
MSLLDRVEMTVASAPGTGTITLGSAVVGYQSFSGAGAVNNGVYSYLLKDGNNWEYGRGTYTTSGTLFARTTIINSILGVATPINASSSTIVAIVALAEDLNSLLGPGGLVPKAAALSFNTWLNQNTSTETDSLAGMSFSIPNNGNLHLPSGLYKTAPATPYTITAFLNMGSITSPGSNCYVLIGWYDGTNNLDCLAISPFYSGYLSYGNNWYDTLATGGSPVGGVGANIPGPIPILNDSGLWVQLSITSVAVGAQTAVNTITAAMSGDGVNYQTLWQYPVSQGYLSFAGLGYNNIFIGGDAFVSNVYFTVSSYTD